MGLGRRGRCRLRRGWPRRRVRQRRVADRNLRRRRVDLLRDDALLVVVLITDEEDDHELDGCMQDPQPGSPGDPVGWFNAVIAAKGGDESNVVVLSLVGPSEPPQCPALDKCNGGIDGAEVATRVLEFTEMFTYGFVGPICEPYGPLFVEAIGVIKSACDEFEPPG